MDDKEKTKKNALKIAFGAWDMSKESGIEYVRDLRDKEEKRLKKLGL